jgi:Zn finger protein HypA/HybF involved in hydrogenase expression
VFMSLCKTCKIEFKPIKNSEDLYCSNKCQHDYQYCSYISRWLNKEECGWTSKTRQVSKHIKRWLKETRGTACSECGWDEEHPIDNAPLTEIDHIDGDAENNRPENLRVLCPNCHSKTVTYRARNKSSKRQRK